MTLPRTAKAAYFTWLNRGKESIALDIKDDEDRAILLKMLETADVFIQNLLPGALKKLGLDSTNRRGDLDNQAADPILGNPGTTRSSPSSPSWRTHRRDFAPGRFVTLPGSAGAEYLYSVSRKT